MYTERTSPDLSRTGYASRRSSQNSAMDEISERLHRLFEPQEKRP